MKYDPIKKVLGKYFNKAPFLRKLFYKLLNLLLLRTWHIKKEVKAFARSNKSHQPMEVLDAGSGFGQYTYFIGSHFKKWTIKAVDVKKEQIDDCSRFFSRINMNHAVFEVADLTTFNENNKYGLVLSVDVMEHIDDDVQVFKNLNKAMKAGAMLLISTPSDQGGSDVHHHHDEGYENNGTHSFIDEHVRDGYNMDEIGEKLKNAGFRAIEAKYSYGTPGKLSWKLSMKYPIMMLNTSKLFFILLPVYYILTFPLCLFLNYLDVKIDHKTGTGLIVKAWK